MALFAIWPADGVSAEEQHRQLLDAAHIVPEHVVAASVGDLQLAAFACTSHFYSAERQVWIDPAAGACIIHGLIWRLSTGETLDAEAVGRLLLHPGDRLPEDVAGEYVVVRIHADGHAEGWSDPAGLHQLFHHEQGSAILSNRAAFVSLLAGGRAPAQESALWLTAMGYRAGQASSWSGVRQLAQGARFVADAGGCRVVNAPLALPAARGFPAGGEALIRQGLAQAQTAIRLATGEGSIDLPITGGKDSRVVLALALSAGLHDRLMLFTRGHAGHPDVVVGELIAERLGLPHRREPPLGSDLPSDLAPAAFVALLKAIAFQTDGGMGGWDNVTAAAPGAATLISGHLGEVLKAYAKSVPDDPLDPIAVVRLQAPFDPMDLIRPEARQRLAAVLADQMREARRASADTADQPDLFYWRNRVPNWLGGIRGTKSFERQPVLPLGVPALMKLAFLMTAAERRMELAHFKLIEAAAPELIDLPFAHQSWHPDLGAAAVPPVLAAAGSALFGSWQWSVNRVPGVRAALADTFAQMDIPLWGDVDRSRLLHLLRTHRFDYGDLISFLGLAVAAFHQASVAPGVKIGDIPTGPPAVVGVAPRIEGHVDVLRVEGGIVQVDGWAWAPDWPGAGVAVEAKLDGMLLIAGAAERPRPDLAAASIGDGRHGFSLRFDAELLRGGMALRIAGIGNDDALVGGAASVKALLGSA